MEAKKHVILDHPILGYFLLMIFTMILESVGSLLDNAIAMFLPGYGTETVMFGNKFTQATGIGTAIGAMAALGFFYLLFRNEFNGILKKEGLKSGLLMLLPVLLFHYVGSVVSWLAVGTVGIGGVFIAFLRALAPGFGEEITFRGLGVANFMRTIKSESQIKTIFWLSSIVFGLIHSTNALAGGDPFSVAVQCVYAIGIGMALGGMYLRTGNLWPAIIGHMSLDFMEFLRKDLFASSGLMTGGLTAGDWITIAAGAFGAVWGLCLIAPKHYPEIMEVWNKAWNRHGK